MKHFYNIERNESDICMVSLFDASTEYSMPVAWFDGIEENIREHFMAWLAHVKAYCVQRTAFEKALAALCRNGGNENE